MNRKRVLKSWWLWGLLVLFVVFILPSLLTGGSSYHGVSTSDALNQLSSNNVKSAVVSDKEQTLQLTLDKDFEGKYQKISTQYPDGATSHVYTALTDAQKGSAHTQWRTKVTHENTWLSLLVSLLPILLIVGVLFFVMSQVQGGGNRVMSFGRSKAKLVNKDTPKTTFGDVAGADEAIEELEEIKDFLASPAKFQAIGAKIPKGVLLYGPPGTGKTLLAKAVAREADANFIATKSSDLLSKWHGESEQQIARLFARARQVAPCVIFIDELDSLVPARGGGMGEPQVTERVVNTVLAEMDGLEELQSVVVIGATNRPNLLDPALLRPGRFDELIYVAVPDEGGRRRILGIHTGNMPLGSDVDLDLLARKTDRFTGADLEDLVRRAGLTALRRSLTAEAVVAADFEEALGETRASVTPEVEREYEQMQARLKQDAMALEPIGFVSPGMLKPRGGKGD